MPAIDAPLPSERGFSSSSLFVWLFALAVSTRVVYNETAQLFFFSTLFACGWSFPSLRTGVLASLQRFLARSEGKIVLLLLLSATLTTLLASVRSDKALGAILWFNWLKTLTVSIALFGCTALLAQPRELLQRTFRLVALFLFAAMFVWASLMVAERLSPGFSAPYSQHAYLYWLYSQMGMVAIFFPLLLAAFASKGNHIAFAQTAPHSITTSLFATPLFWRCCVAGAALLLLCAAVLTERRIMGVALSASLFVLVLALGLRSHLRLWLPLSVLGVLLFVAIFLLYLYHNPIVYGVESRLCESCNILYLPSWLVDDARQIVWHETLLVWQDHPWLGRGIRNDLTFSVTHPHSRFLQVLSGLGIVGFVLFVSLLSLVFVKACLRWSRTGSLSSLSLMFVHCVYWATGLFDLSVWVPWHFCMYASAIVLSACLDRLDARAEGC